MNNEQFKKYASLQQEIDAYIEKRARRKHTSIYPTSRIYYDEVGDYTVETNPSSKTAIVTWVGCGSLVGNYEAYYDDFEVEQSISYEDLALTEKEFNERYSLCKK